MRSILSVVTQEDILTFFKGKDWETEIRRSGMITCESKKWTVELEPHGDPLFAIEIHSYEEESDSDEMITDEPIKFIEEFIQGEAPRLSCTDPHKFAGLLRNWADRIASHMIGPRASARILRRACILPELHSTSRILAALIRQAKTGIDGTKKLADELQKKGWKVEFKTNPCNCSKYSWGF